MTGVLARCGQTSCRAVVYIPLIVPMSTVQAYLSRSHIINAAMALLDTVRTRSRHILENRGKIQPVTAAIVRKLMRERFPDNKFFKYATICTYCKQPGHIAAICPLLPSMPSQPRCTFLETIVNSPQILVADTYPASNTPQQNLRRWGPRSRY